MQDSTDRPTSTDRPIRDTLAAVPWRSLLAAVPVVLVNAVAFAGQLAFLHAHLPWPPAGQVLLAVTLESVAVYLAFHAHLAQMADDSALRLRLAAYAFALVIAAMNYSHYAAPGWRPTFAAVALGLMSASSPWLWSVHSRRVSRDVLLAAGLIEPHALRLGGTRWMWHPYRSARVMQAASWDGERDPARAITAVYPAAGAQPQTVLSTVPSSVLEAAKARLRFALEHGFKVTDNELHDKFSLSRAQATTARQEVLAEMNGNGPHA